MDLICFLWRAEPRGTLSLSPVQWLKLLRCDPGTFATVTEELAMYNICDIETISNDCVMVSSRRMTREEKQRKANRLRVRRHRSNKPRNAAVQDCNRENQNHISESEVRSQNQKSESESGEEKEKTPEKSGGPVSRPPAKSNATWEAYAEAYRQRYGVSPVRNQKTNVHLCQLVDRLGAEEAPQVAAFYCSHSLPFYMRARHPTNLLVQDAEGLRTQWATGVKATTLETKSAEQRDSAREQIQRVRTALGGA